MALSLLTTYCVLKCIYTQYCKHLFKFELHMVVTVKLEHTGLACTQCAGVLHSW